MTDHRELVAYHEAGHAVACYALHRPFEYVTLVEDENGERLGHIPHPPSSRWYFDHFLNVDAAAWDSALHALAGPVAEYRRMGGDDEWGNIHEYLKTEQIPDDGPEADQHAAENYLMIHSRERNLYNLKGVRDSLFSLCLQTAVALVDQYWDSITAVAEALLEKETLSCTEARALTTGALKLEGQ